MDVVSSIGQLLSWVEIEDIIENEYCKANSGMRCTAQSPRRLAAAQPAGKA